MSFFSSDPKTMAAQNKLAKSPLAPAPSALGRSKNVPGAIDTGEKAVPRGSAPATPSGPTPPDATKDASEAALAALAAGLRARRRGAAGNLGPSLNTKGPAPRLMPKSLLGY